MPVATPTEERPIVRQGIEWQQFLVMQEALAVVPGLRLNYWEGYLEIMPISKLHEYICALLTGYLHIYFLHKRLRVFPSGAYSQVVEGKAQFQADLSYSFDTDKALPDLCIEVVISSGSIDKLRKYKLRGVPEVWFWQDYTIHIYTWNGEDYATVDKSKFLPDLDLHFLCQCLAEPDPLAGSLQFQARYNPTL